MHLTFTYIGHQTFTFLMQHMGLPNHIPKCLQRDNNCCFLTYPLQRCGHRFPSHIFTTFFLLLFYSLPHICSTVDQVIWFLSSIYLFWVWEIKLPSNTAGYHWIHVWWQNPKIWLLNQKKISPYTESSGWTDTKR